MRAIKDTPGVVAPPPLLYAAAFGVGLAVDFLLLRIETGLAAQLRYGLAALLFVAAVVLAVSALRRFRRAGTHAEPWRETTAIVTDGVYSVTRNPMYLAATLLYVAAALAADSVVTLLLLVPLLIVLHYGVIRREERYLEAKFGEEYRRYKAAVRRWL